MNDRFGYYDYQAEYVQAQPSASQSKSSGYATASLVLGILSVFGTCCCCCLLPLNLITGILAVVFAFVSKRGGNRLTAKARWGLILGLIGILLFVITSGVILRSDGLGLSSEATQAWLEEMQNYYASPEDYPDGPPAYGDFLPS